MQDHHVLQWDKFNTFPLKRVIGDRLSSALIFFLNFDIFGKYLNESCSEHSIEQDYQVNNFPRRALALSARSSFGVG